LKLADFGVMALAKQQPRHFDLQLIGRALDVPEVYNSSNSFEGRKELQL
jgi:hypothetical protein